MHADKERSATALVSFVQKASRELVPPVKNKSTGSPQLNVVTKHGAMDQAHTHVSAPPVHTLASPSLGQCIDAHLILSAFGCILPIVMLCVGMLVGWKVRGFDNRKRQ